MGQPLPPTSGWTPAFPVKTQIHLGVDQGEPRSLASREALLPGFTGEEGLPGEQGPSPSEGLQLTWL